MTKTARVYHLSFWLRHARKVVILMIGGTVLLIGVAFIVLPGPAFIVIPLGLAILATEFAWARRWLVKAQAMAEKAANATPGGKKASAKAKKIAGHVRGWFQK